jgi:hypothetical protein
MLRCHRSQPQPQARVRRGVILFSGSGQGSETVTAQPNGTPLSDGSQGPTSLKPSQESSRLLYGWLTNRFQISLATAHYTGILGASRASTGDSDGPLPEPGLRPRLHRFPRIPHEESTLRSMPVMKSCGWAVHLIKPWNANASLGPSILTLRPTGLYSGLGVKA